MTETPSEKSSDDGQNLNDQADGTIARKRKRSWCRRLGLTALYSILAFVVVLVVVAITFMGRPVMAPEWVKSRIETQLNSQLQATQVRFASLSVIVEDFWKPRVKLDDIELLGEAGETIVRLSDVEGTLALAPLFQGKVQPSRVWLTGAQLVLRRDKDGRVGLSFGDASATTSQAAGFVQLVEQIDRALVSPSLANLKDFTADGLTVRYEDARAGRAWTVDGGRVNLSRVDDVLTLRGDFAVLSGGASAAVIEMNYQSQIGSAAAAFGMNFSDLRADDIAAQSAALVWLNVLRAPISGALRASTDDAGNLGPLFATLHIGEGVLQPTDETKPIPFQSAKSYFTYSPNDQTMQLDELSFDTNWGAARAGGKVVLGAIKNGLPTEFISQLRLTDISANPNKLFAAPVKFSNVLVDTRLKLDPFQLSVGQLTLQDTDGKLVLGGELGADARGWNVSLSGSLDRLSPTRLLELWPESLVKNTRDWIERNVLSGELRNIQLALRWEPQEKPVTYLGFDFDSFESTFMKAMPPIRGARGHATLYQNSFTVTALNGQVSPEQGGPLDITGTVFRIPDVTVKKGPAEVLLNTNSTVTAVLSLLDREPFRFISKSGQKVTLADGTAKVTGRVDFALKKKIPVEEVSYDAVAELQNIRSEVLIPGHVLSAPRLKATATTKELRISGDGRIGQVPVSGVFAAPLGKGGSGKSRLEGTIELSKRFVDEFKIGLPPGSVAGNSQGDIRIDLQRGQKPSFSLTSRLAGLALRIPQISWGMSQAARGKLEVAGQLGAPAQINKIALDAPGLRASGKLALNSDGSFRSATFERVRAGSWLDAPIELIGRGAGRAPEVRVTGGTVDLSQTEIGSGTGTSGSSGGGPLKVALNRLRISEGIALTGFKGEFQTARGIDGRFSGKINGGAPVTGRVIPQRGRSAFRIQSENAGGVFQSAGLFPSARGGKLDLTLVPGGGAGSYDGRMKVTNIWLRKAPAMAALLNAISVIGLLEQLGGKGILFAEVDAQFRLTPTQAIITKSSAIGNSMGISMDGYYNLASGAMNMQGTVSPFYLLNGVGSVLTRKGEGLVGFTYRLKGTSDKPRVQVNPLSLLTPGMFREIFRRSPPKLTQ